MPHKKVNPMQTLSSKNMAIFERGKKTVILMAQLHLARCAMDIAHGSIYGK